MANKIKEANFQLNSDVILQQVKTALSMMDTDDRTPIICEDIESGNQYNITGITVWEDKLIISICR